MPLVWFWKQMQTQSPGIIGRFVSSGSELTKRSLSKRIMLLVYNLYKIKHVALLLWRSLGKYKRYLKNILIWESMGIFAQASSGHFRNCSFWHFKHKCLLMSSSVDSKTKAWPTNVWSIVLVFSFCSIIMDIKQQRINLYVVLNAHMATQPTASINQLYSCSLAQKHTCCPHLG